MKKLISALIACFLSVSASAATIYVDANGTGDYTTIQDAIDDANDGDEIILADGTYTGGGNRDIDFLGKAVTLRSENGPNNCIIDCNGTKAEPHRGFYFHSGEDANSVLDGLTITNGYAGGLEPYGGGIYCSQSSPTIKNCKFSGNSAKWDGGGMYNYLGDPMITNCIFSNNWTRDLGGGMYNDDKSSPTLTNCTFIANSASGSPWAIGGGMYNSGSPTLTNCTFSGNSAEDRGGGMVNGGSPTLVNCTFSGNSANSDGGGMFNLYNSSPTLTNCTFIGNSVGNYGGGIGIDWEGVWEYCKLKLTNCTFSSNLAKFGGGLFIYYEVSATLTNCTFSENSAEEYGGALYNEGGSLLTINDCTFSENQAGYDGGGMCNLYYYKNSSPTLTNCTFSGNSAVYGGGMYNYNNSPTLTNCIFSDNTARRGGAMYNRLSNMVITNCTFSENSTQYDGGGMYSDYSSPTLTNCVFSGNSAENYGGGMSNTYESSPTLTNCIFSGNSAYSGGGMNNYRYSSPTLTNCTFSGNSARDIGGGFYNYYRSKPPLTNCILWDNTASSSGSQICDDGYSVTTATFSDIEGGWPGTGNIDTDPCFIDTGYWDPNGTPTDANDDFWVDGDYHLLVQSLCINAGDPCYVPEPNETDLDGRPRVIDGRIDMGVYEYYNTQPVAVAGPNQIAYAFIDGYADVNLDGSDSYDDDNDVLDYYWSWTIDGNVYEASGIAPIIELPIGKHEIELVVDDGIDLSEPNHCTVTVIAPLQAWLFCIPSTLYQKTWYPKSVSALISMPLGIHKADINLTEPLTFYPGQVESQCQFAFEFGWHWKPRTYVWASFDKSACAEYLEPGFNSVNVVGKLTTGRYYDAAGYLKLVPWKWHHWPHPIRR